MNSPMDWFIRPSQKFTDQPPCSKPPVGSSSGPPGACITPSRLTNVFTTSFLMAAPPWSSTDLTPPEAELIGGTARASPGHNLGEPAPLEVRLLLRRARRCLWCEPSLGEATA